MVRENRGFWGGPGEERLLGELGLWLVGVTVWMGLVGAGLVGAGLARERPALPAGRIPERCGVGLTCFRSLCW